MAFIRDTGRYYELDGSLRGWPSRVESYKGWAILDMGDGTFKGTKRYAGGRTLNVGARSIETVRQQIDKRLANVFHGGQRPPAAQPTGPQHVGSFDGYDIFLQPLPPSSMVTMVVRPHPLGTVSVKRDGTEVASEKLTGQENPLAVGRRLISQIKNSAKEETTVTQPAPTAPKPEQTPAGLTNATKLALGLGAGAVALVLLK